ncbi:uncharacterized protein RCC_03716 [Ramularia collo-cygni]|uniref:F-box domain-containing protein n=1 Tax=Ramularia collo-cygni TaxID=112498 RepID=A0A2D3UXI7_9PEZI|nr:uncharacterized protein RCC_03716 [Ramularia collo-cygni]CZT17880.1 uncharacterized protein RCC_03716 [Ramularia collo-cygni]
MENSPLAKLPAELLNDIVEMALTHNEVVLSGSRKMPNAASLLQTCKTMREGYSTMFFSTNDFIYCPMSTDCLKDISRFEDVIGPSKVEAMGSMVVLMRVPAYKEGAPPIARAIKAFCNARERPSIPGSKLSISGVFLELTYDNVSFRRFFIDLQHPSDSIFPIIRDIRKEQDDTYSRAVEKEKVSQVDDHWLRINQYSDLQDALGDLDDTVRSVYYSLASDGK